MILLFISVFLCHYGSPLDVNSEVNNGRGPVDFKISCGKKNSTLVEFKLASNTKLKQNLENQVDIYKSAAETNRAIKVIMFFTEKEYASITKGFRNVLNLVERRDDDWKLFLAGGAGYSSW